VPLPATVDLSFYRGDTWAQSFRLSRDGAPVDLMTATVTCWARRSAIVETLTVLVGPDPGVVTISRSDLSAGPWRYDIEVEETDGTIQTWVQGRLIIEQDVSNAV